MFLFKAAADDEDGPETLGVDGAVIVGLPGVVEVFLVAVKDGVVDEAPKEERRELALLLVAPNLRLEDMFRLFLVGKSYYPYNLFLYLQYSCDKWYDEKI